MQCSIPTPRPQFAAFAACLALLAGGCWVSAASAARLVEEEGDAASVAASLRPGGEAVSSHTGDEPGRRMTRLSNAGPTIRVNGDDEFAAAVAQLRRTGGTIVLGPRRFGQLIVGPRSNKPLVIVAERGAEAQRVLFDHTQQVELSGVRVSPLHTGPATVDVVDSHDITLAQLIVTSGRTRRPAGLAIWRSSRIAVTDSLFERCGDGELCVRLKQTRDVTIANSIFRDCYGCDFVHGHSNTGVELRGNSFQRALVGDCGRDRERCNHQDLVQLVEGGNVVIDGNRFGVHEHGAAQLYLTGEIRRVVITNNVFVPTDPLAPGRLAETAIWVGNKRTTVVPLDVTIEGNTILTGSVRRGGRANRGTANSILLSPAYASKPAALRPLVANNVVGLTGTPDRLCSQVQASVANVVITGTPCSATDVLGEPELDASGQPTAASTLLIDRAFLRYSPPVDIRGIARGETPDVGAFEYVG
jgi:hypothetical protein